MVVLLEFDADRDIVLALKDNRFDRVIHIFDANWHGIRSATACLPGHKLAMSHQNTLDGEFFRHLVGLVSAWRIQVVCLQGLSRNALSIAETLRKDFGDALHISAVTHVTSAQFENYFEIEMQKAALDLLRRGILNRLASVKPDFHRAVAQTWPQTIFNAAPNIAYLRPIERDESAVFIPVENTWRKNLYTNVLGAAAISDVTRVYCVNHPTGLELIADISKVRLTGYLRGLNLYSFMASVSVILNVTLAECQPMTQLEALGAGVPCITGPLALPGFEDHPMTRLTEVLQLDSPGSITHAMSTLIQEMRADPKGFAAMLDDYLDLRNRACLKSYGELLEVG